MIRPAKPSDYGEILNMSEKFWAHSSFDEPFDAQHTLLNVEDCANNGVLLVSGQAVINGFIAAKIMPLLGSPAAKMAVEIAWYVKPQKRGKLYGLELIQALERRCIALKVKYLCMAYMESSMPEKVRELYLSLGYRQQETTFVKVLYGGSDISSCSKLSNSGLLSEKAERCGKISGAPRGRGRPSG